MWQPDLPWIWIPIFYKEWISGHYFVEIIPTGICFDVLYFTYTFYNVITTILSLVFFLINLVSSLSGSYLVSKQPKQLIEEALEVWYANQDPEQYLQKYSGELYHSVVCNLHCAGQEGSPHAIKTAQHWSPLYRTFTPAGSSGGPTTVSLLNLVFLCFPVFSLPLVFPSIVITCPALTVVTCLLLTQDCI